LLPARSKIAKVQHHAALPYAEIPQFMTDLRARDDVAARALEFTILTAARTSEAIEVRRKEIDFDARMWIVPAGRMKGAREHRVPLSDRALEILKTAKTEGDYFFPGRKTRTPLSNMALLMTLRRMDRDDLTVHGFRSTFRDWGAELTAYPTEMLEMALAHAVSDKVEAAYRRGDMFEKRRRLMADWATYCATAARTAENVIPLRPLGAP
jgi:integrase